MKVQRAGQMENEVRVNPQWRGKHNVLDEHHTSDRRAENRERSSAGFPPGRLREIRGTADKVQRKRVPSESW